MGVSLKGGLHLRTNEFVIKVDTNISHCKFTLLNFLFEKCYLIFYRFKEKIMYYKVLKWLMKASE